ncbi:MAG: phosphatase PAP2 family protein [Ignavibacteriales bacterium]|nr:phosphatase PAP2 family protein [Ignavibacteriales bacterium]
MQPIENSVDRIWRATDLLCYLFAATLVVLAAVFPERVTNPHTVIQQLLVAALVFWGTSRLANGIGASLVLVLLQTGRVVGLSSFLFQLMANFQHLIVADWMDHSLLSVERSITGTETSVFLQRLANPLATEGMMFAYIMYVPLLPLVAFLCYWSKGIRATGEYLLNLTLAFFACYVGFILYPLASPLYHQPEAYTVPLQGGLFTWCGEWIRQNQHYAGGSLPSPHCAAATVMIVMLYRHNRKAFFVLLPTLLMIYVAAVYGRYHYAWDGIAAILSASLSVKWSGRVATAFKFFEGKPSILQQLTAVQTDTEERKKKWNMSW